MRPARNWPILLASTRDELRSRPAVGPLDWPGRAFVAPRDEQAGGTWLGLNRAGVYVAVTNRYPSARHPERRSRGQLVVEALAAPDARTLHARLSRLTPSEFNAFHLLYGNRDEAFLTWSDGAQLHQGVLGPGLHVITERSLQGPPPARERLIRAAWPGELGEAPAAAVRRILCLRDEGDPTAGVEVDLPALGYGTRSSSLLLLGRRPGELRWFWGEGRPSEVEWAERPDLVAALTHPAT